MHRALPACITTLFYNLCTIIAQSVPNTSKEPITVGAGVSEPTKEKKTQKGEKSKSVEESHHESDEAETLNEKQENKFLTEVPKITLSTSSTAFKQTFVS